MSQDKIAQLEAVEGWAWCAFEAFEKGLTAFKQYVAIHGHANIKATFKTENGYALGTWVSRRRSEHKKGTLSQDKIAQLEAVEGWVWDIFEARFEKALTAIKQYVAIHGHANIPKRFKTEDDFELGSWLQNRRKYYKEGTLSQDKIAQLEAVEGWAWKVK